MNRNEAIGVARTASGLSQTGPTLSQTGPTLSQTEPIGTFCLVLHSHLPWLAHHGNWPVGEEWLYQSWAAAYLPLYRMLRQFAAEGRRDVLTLGITPVLAAQLDDPHCLSAFATWLGFWQTRARELALNNDPTLRSVARREWDSATSAAQDLTTSWRHGGSPALRQLVDAGVIEYLGGPATHSFLPLLDERVSQFALDVGLADATLRLGQRPTGIWAPECGYRPGLEDLYQASNVRHFVVDGPTLLHVGANPACAWTVGDSDVAAFGRDLDVTYRVWSPRRGYPGGPWYRDFHAFHHESGFRPYRVTSPKLAGDRKAPYDPAAAAAAVTRDADDFVSVVVKRLKQLTSARDGNPALVVAAYDTELFGHWWHEGPIWLEQVLRKLPEAGVRVTTLQGAVEAGCVGGKANLESGSWGSGKDYRVWDGPQIADIVADNDQLQRRFVKLVDSFRADPAGTQRTRNPALDQAARLALLALSSDWAFMITKDSAADYARARHQEHHRDFNSLAAALERAAAGNRPAEAHALELAGRFAHRDRPFGHVDARQLVELR